MAERRQVTEHEKQQILQEHGGRRCFVDGAPIPEEETIEFHHIKAYSEGGKTNLANIAPVCKKHHRTIGTMSLQEYRDKLSLGRFFEDGEPKYLDDLIRAKTGKSVEKLSFEVSGDNILIYLDNARLSLPLYLCPTTNWQYFYATLPIQYLENDRDLQPRALRYNSLWSLYRHFQVNTQLSPSICRIDSDRILRLFDGQHKAAAQIWAGRKVVECKVYLEPDSIVLKETNLEAHGKFRQMSFYSHELMRKYADIFGEDWAQYMDTEGEKSEAGFLNFLTNTKKKTKAKARFEISLATFNQIIDDPTNKLSVFLSEKNRSKKQPLTFARLKKTLLKEMLLPPPVEDEFESEKDYRIPERLNLIRFMNIIAEVGLEGKWNPELNNSIHKKAQKIFSAGSVRAWTILLKDTINIHLKHYNEDERRCFFYRQINDENFEYFRKFTIKLFSHKIWDDPDPTGEIAARLAKDDATTARNLFEEKGLTVKWLLGIQ